MLLIGDVYDQDYLRSHAYAYAAALGQGGIVDEARARMRHADAHLRSDQILAAERLAQVLVGR